MFPGMLTFKKSFKTIKIFSLDCPYDAMYIGDNFCDDMTNNPECGFDGGDCCKPYSNMNFCSDCICIVHNEKMPNGTKGTQKTKVPYQIKES